MGKMIVFRCAASLLLILLPLGLWAQEATVLGTVGGNRVTTVDAEAHLARTGGARPGETPEEARWRAANELLAAHVVDELFSRGTRLNTEIQRALDQQRRLTLLELHLRANLQAAQPTDAEIDAFVAANPHLFSERRSYWFSQIFLAQPQAQERSAFDRALATLRSGPMTPERVLVFQQQLMEAGLQHERRTHWYPSEQLGSEFRAALDALHAAGQGEELIERGGTIELRLLLGRFDDPVDPALQRRQVGQALLQQAATVQREAMIADLALRARSIPIAAAPEPAVDPPPPPPRERPVAELWMFGVIAGIALMLPLAIWSGKRFGRTLAYSAAAWAMRLGVLAIILGGLAAAGWVGYRLHPAVGLRPLGALAAGGLVMGGLIAGAWGRHLMIYEPRPFRDGVRFVLSAAVLVGLFGVYLAGQQGLL